MKKSFLYISAAMIAASAALTACDDNFVHPPVIMPPAVEVDATTTLADFKTEFWGAVSAPTTIDVNPTTGDSIIFKGRVCSSDATGNIYKSIIVQGHDEKGNQIAINFSVNSYDLYQLFPFGQEVAVYATGLSVGGYRNLMQFGAINGNEMTFMDADLFTEHVVRTGSALPEPAKVDTTLATIGHILECKENNDSLRAWQSRLIRIEGVSFEDAGQPFAGAATVDRYITDAEGKRIAVRNSAYADFKNEILPYGTGNVTGILSYYNTNWQILLIDADGCQDFDGEAPEKPEAPAPAGEGTLDNPYNVAAALELISKMSSSDSKTAYVKGIVTAVSDISTSFGNATYKIADVEGGETLGVYRGFWFNGDKFTSESQLQVGAEVIVTGDLVNFMGNTPQFTTGNHIVSYNGKTEDGGTTTDPSAPAGEGTLASPYNVAAALGVAKSLSDTGTQEAYVKGKISAITEISPSFGNATYTIVDVDGAEGLSVYRGYGLDGAKFTSEDDLAVGADVVVYGTLVNFKGNTPQFTTGSVIVSYNGQGGSGSDTPAPGTLFSESFATSLGDFTMNNVKLPSELTYVWSWGGANYGAKASAFINNTSYASESWLISPVIDLSAATAPVLVFEHVYNKFPTLDFAKQSCHLMGRTEGGEWAEIAIPTCSPNTDWNFVSSGDIDLKAYAGKKMQIAFKYTSEDGKSGTWEVKNLTITNK